MDEAYDDDPIRNRVTWPGAGRDKETWTASIIYSWLATSIVSSFYCRNAGEARELVSHNACDFVMGGLLS